MTVTLPLVHVPRPYERPHANLACRVDVPPCEDGAVVAAFVYAPHGVRDQPARLFGIDPHVPPVLMLHGNGEEHGIFGRPSTPSPPRALRGGHRPPSPGRVHPRPRALLTSWAADAREVMMRLGAPGSATCWDSPTVPSWASPCARLGPARTHAHERRRKTSRRRGSRRRTNAGWRRPPRQRRMGGPRPRGRLRRGRKTPCPPPPRPDASPSSCSSWLTSRASRRLAGENIVPGHCHGWRASDCILPEETERIAAAIPGARTYVGAWLRAILCPRRRLTR